jgi:DNA repair exonuclease SbcCD nuclease subunit
VNKWLLVGDPHARAQDISEIRLLWRFMIQQAKANDCQGIRILGDLGHTFSIVHVDVLTEWTYFCEAAVEENIQLEFLVGNHDFAGQDGGNDFLKAFGWAATVMRFREPVKLGEAYYMPFYRDIKLFEEHCRKIPSGSLLYCHQSFNGAKFENGFYDPHGADPECAAHLEQVVSGHVHVRQAFANIWYPGSPRHLSFADVGERKVVYVVEQVDNKLRIIKELQTPGAQYYTLAAATIPELLETVKSTTPLPDGHFRFEARGGSTEIAAFWRDDAVKSFREGSRRVVDNLQANRVHTKLLENVPANATPKVRFDAYIASKKWRTPVTRLARSAEELLSSSGQT